MRNVPRTSFRPRLLACAAVATALFVASTARAQEPPTRPVVEALEVGPSDCLLPERLAGHVETWLGRPQIDRRVGVRVRDLRAEGRGVTFEIMREGESVAERRMQPRSIACGDLAAAVGLAIALSIDATFLQSILPEVTAVAPKAAPPEPAPKPTQKPAPTPATRQPEPSAPLYGIAQAEGLIGVAPIPVLGGAIGAGLGVGPPFELRLGGLGTANHNMSLGSGQVDVGLVAGRADACMTTPVDALSLGVCAGVVAGRWVARGRDFDVNHTTTVPWAAAVARFEGRVEIARGVLLVFSLDGYAPFYRPVLDVTDGSGRTVTSSQAPATGLGIGVGPAVKFL